MYETQVWFLGQEDHLEKEMAIHSSILAWRLPWTEEPGGLQFIGSQRVRYNWSNSECSQLPTNQQGTEVLSPTPQMNWILPMITERTLKLAHDEVTAALEDTLTAALDEILKQGTQLSPAQAPNPQKLWYNKCILFYAVKLCYVATYSKDTLILNKNRVGGWRETMD